MHTWHVFEKNFIHLLQEFLQNIWQFVISRGKCKILFPNQLPSSIFRIVLLIAGTILLLTARIRVMGAQLPVFTKYDLAISIF